MKRTNLLILSLCTLGLTFTGCNDTRPKNPDMVVISQSDKAWIKSDYLKSIWKPGYRYAVMIPEDTTAIVYHRLIESLKSNQPYNSENTFIICQANDEAKIEEWLPDYSILVSDQFVKESACKNVCYFTIGKGERKGEEEYIVLEQR